MIDQEHGAQVLGTLQSTPGDTFGGCPWIVVTLGGCFTFGLTDAELSCSGAGGDAAFEQTQQFRNEGGLARATHSGEADQASEGNGDVDVGEIVAGDVVQEQVRGCDGCLGSVGGGEVGELQRGGDRGSGAAGGPE